MIRHGHQDPEQGATTDPTDGAASGKGPVAVITGAASGLGLATAIVLHERGFRVVISDRDQTTAAVAARELDPTGMTAMGALADVSSTAAVNELFEQAYGWSGGVDLLVNNAGFSAPSPTASLPDEAWAHMLDVHLTGTMRTCRAAYPFLRLSDRPAIVSMSSMAGKVGIGGRASYSAAKAGIEGLTRSLAVEWAAEGIRVNAVAPGFIDTKLMRDLISSGLRSEKAMSDHVPLKRLGTAREVATVIAFLGSPDANYVTGQVLAVDGGVTISGGT